MEKNPGGCAYVKKTALIGEECFEMGNNPLKIFSTARSFFLVERIFDLAVEKEDQFGRRAGVRKNMAACETTAQVPDFPILTVGDLDLTFVQLENVKGFFSEEGDVRT